MQTAHKAAEGAQTMRAADLDALDQLGPVLCAFGARRVSLAWVAPIGVTAGFYHVDWRDDRGRFFSGGGDSPSEAVEVALGNAGLFRLPEAA